MKHRHVEPYWPHSNPEPPQHRSAERSRASRPHTDARADLHWVRNRWPDLWDARLKGTARPWREPQLSPEQREEADRQARAEKRERSDRMPGESPAPLHVDILDDLASVLMTADLLHEHIAATIGHPTLTHPASIAEDPRPYLDYVLELLAEAVDTDPATAYRALDDARSMRTRIARALGEVVDGQTLKATCPFCGGKDDTHPVGGALTLRIRLMPMPTRADPQAQLPMVVCEGGHCNPTSHDCGTRWRGKPAWPIHEWEWLAAQLGGAA